MADFVGEKLKKTTAAKDVYHFINEEKKINQLSKETFKTGSTEIHFPIGYEGGPKYKTI